jgi:hypothetical protein
MVGPADSSMTIASQHHRTRTMVANASSRAACSAAMRSRRGYAAGLLGAAVALGGCGPSRGVEDEGGTTTETMSVDASQTSGMSGPDGATDLDATTAATTEEGDTANESGCDPVVFEDAIVEAAVRKRLDLLSGPISSEAIGSLTELELSGPELFSLEGLQCAANLERLDVAGSWTGRRPPLDLTPISKLEALRLLGVNGFQLDDLEPLVHLANLESLTLVSDGITDVESLAGLTNLRTLHLHGENHIDDIGPLAGLTNLEVFNIGGLIDYSGNAVDDISPVANMKNLIEFRAEANQIVDVSPIASISQIGSIHLEFNQIVDLSALVGVQWELVSPCATLYLVYNPLSEETVVEHIPQICAHSGVQVDGYCLKECCTLGTRCD